MKNMMLSVITGCRLWAVEALKDSPIARHQNEKGNQEAEKEKQWENVEIWGHCVKLSRDGNKKTRKGNISLKVRKYES